MNKNRLILISLFLIVTILAGFGLAQEALAGGYLSQGTLTSTNLLFDRTVISIDSFWYNASAIPGNTSLKIQFSRDNSNWYNSSGNLGQWNTLFQGQNTISLSSLGWSGQNFYYKIQFTSDGNNTPVLDEISVNFTSIPCSSHNVSGWAWSENIGWINFSCKNQNNPSDYGVDINTSTGNFSGYAWSENIGWIDFAPSGPFPSAPNYSVCLDFPGSGQICDDLGSNKVGGWARALSFGGGWDGWIKLRGSNYGIDLNQQSGELSGFVWSDMVIGWISFNCSSQGTCGTSNYKVVTTAKLPPSVSTSAGGVTWDNCSFQGKSIPILHWDYSDGIQVAYWVQIDNTSASFPSPEIDTGEILSSSSSYAPAYSFNWDKKYWWRVKAKNQQGVWSNWSNIDNFTTPKHAYPWSGFSWLPQNPNQGEVVIFTPDQTGLFYLWTITLGEGQYTDSTGPTNEKPHIKFLTSTNRIKLKVTDADAYSCESLPAEGTLLEAKLPLPEYQEVPPLIWLQKALAALVDFFHVF